MESNLDNPYEPSVPLDPYGEPDAFAQPGPYDKPVDSQPMQQDAYGQPISQPNTNQPNPYQPDSYQQQAPNQPNPYQPDPYQQQAPNQPNPYQPDPYQQQAPFQQTYQQTAYGQQMQPQYQQMPNQQMRDSKGMTPEDKHNANLLCIISLICMYGVPFVTGLFTSLFTRNGDISSTGSTLTSLFTSLSGLSTIAAWVLMIIVRVKYRNSTFGKVLMIVYIVMLALVVIGFIILMASCVSCLRSCPG